MANAGYGSMSGYPVDEDSVGSGEGYYGWCGVCVPSADDNGGSVIPKSRDVGTCGL